MLARPRRSFQIRFRRKRYARLWRAVLNVALLCTPEACVPNGGSPTIVELPPFCLLLNLLLNEIEDHTKHLAKNRVLAV